MDNAGDGDNLSYKTSSQIIPTYQHLTFYRPDALPATQPTRTEKHLGLGDFLYPRTLSFTQSLDFCQSSLVFLATVAVGFFYRLDALLDLPSEDTQEQMERESQRDATR